jgi:thiol:disulfide interchange protein DsbA
MIGKRLFARCADGRARVSATLDASTQAARTCIRVPPEARCARLTNEVTQLGFPDLFNSKYNKEVVSDITGRGRSQGSINMRFTASLFTALIIAITCASSAARSAGGLQGPPPAAAIKASGIEWKEGVHYEVLPTPAGTVPAPGKIEIFEFFQYKCPHCYTMEPHMVLWKGMYSNLATVTRVPVTYKPLYRNLARLYYTLEALGRVDVPRDDLHHEVFDQVHRLWRPLATDDEAESFKLQLDFAVSSGIDAAEFTKAYRSAAVEAKMKRADELGNTYRIISTPTFVVAGKYKTTTPQAGDEYRLTYLLTDLAVMTRDARERALTSR